jgi:hypothetical protein
MTDADTGYWRGYEDGRQQGYKDGYTDGYKAGGHKDWCAIHKVYPHDCDCSADINPLRSLAKHGASSAHLEGAGIFSNHTGNLWQCKEQRCIDARNLAWTPEEAAEKMAKHAGA